MAVQLSQVDARLPASAGTPPALSYPPTFHTLGQAALEARYASFAKSGFHVELNAFGFIIRAAKPKERGPSRLQPDDLRVARDFIDAHRDAFGLVPSAAPEVSIENGQFSHVLWKLKFATTSLVVSLHRNPVNGNTPAGPGMPEDEGYEVTLSDHFLPLLDFPATPARKTHQELLKPYLGRAAAAPGKPVVDKATTDPTTAFRGVFLRVTGQTLEVRDVVHFPFVDPSPKKNERKAPGPTLPVVRPWPADEPKPKEPLGLIIDARTGEDLSDTPPWRSRGWFSFNERGRPFDVNHEGFFAANLPFPQLRMPSRNPPP